MKTSGMLMLLSTVCLATSVCSALAQEGTTKPKITTSTKWRWSAKIDESVFAPGGKGVTIYAAPARVAAADGSATKPYDLDSALKQAQETVRSMESEYQRLSSNKTVPVWLRIVRRGNEFAAFSAPDTNGKPGAWSPAGETKTISMGRNIYAGLLVNGNQDWPKDGTFSGATFDNASVNGQKVSDTAWKSQRVGVVRGLVETKISNGLINIKGNGTDANWTNNWADSGQYSFVPFTGDGEVVVRLTGLTPSEHSKAVSAALVVREQLSPGARMVELEMSDKGDNSGLWRGYRSDRATPGKDVKVVLQPGVYRGGMWLPERDEVAQERIFAVEGAKQNGKTGGVIISGSEEWKPATWKSEGNGVYSREWKHNWGGDKVSDRREMVFITLTGGAMQRLEQVLASEWKSAPATFTVDEAKDLITLRLPNNVNVTQWNNALVEVATRNDHLLAFGTMNSRPDDNLILRNLTFQHSAGWNTVQLNWWAEGLSPARNWILEDVTFCQNSGEGFRINHLRDFTMRRVVSVDNGTQNHFIGAEGQIIDCVIDRNGWRRSVDAFWNSLKNVYVYNSSFSGNNGNAFRNDHVAENLVMENCRFNNNTHQGVIFETATGPIVIRNSEVKGNNFQGHESEDAAVGLSTTHNITLDNVTFKNNHRGAIAFYPRERAHTANQEGNDELNNNLDVGHWDQDDTPEGRWTPGGKKAASENRNFIIKNCTFLSDEPQGTFIIQHWYRRGPAYQRNIRQELMAYNNSYYNPKNPRPFQIDNASWKPDTGDKFATFEEWKKISIHPNFEAGSAWGTKAPRNYTPPKLNLAVASKVANPSINASGHLIYEVENLPFKASNPVELISALGTTTNKIHKLHADQVGDYSDWIEYSIEVPHAGNYYVDLRYLQDGRPFNYLGYAQVKVNGAIQGDWIDQHGLTRQLMTHHLGQARFNKGLNTVRVDAIWRNGYLSGDYDITVDRIELSSTQAFHPAATAAPQAGLNYQIFAGGDWTQVPDFSKLKPEDSGTVYSFDLNAAENYEKFGVRFTGFIQVPRDGIYTYATLVNDGANLYIGDQLVVDNDGVHDGEKNEPWLKRGNIALKAGLHPIRVEYFESGGKGRALEVSWAPLGGELQRITPAQLGAFNVAAGPVTTGANLLNGNTVAMQPFTKRMKGNTSLEETGAWPQPWSANLWDENSTGEVVLEKDPVTQRNAIALRNLEGKAALQFYTWQNIDLSPGRYLMRFDYMTMGNDGAQVNLNFKGMDKIEQNLPASPKAWKKFSTTFEVKNTGVGISPQFRNPAMGANKTLYIKSVSLYRLADKQ